MDTDTFEVKVEAEAASVTWQRQTEVLMGGKSVPPETYQVVEFAAGVEAKVN